MAEDVNDAVDSAAPRHGDPEPEDSVAVLMRTLRIRSSSPAFCFDHCVYPCCYVYVDDHLTCKCVPPDMRRDVQEIFRATPHQKQVMMFSATLAKEIRVTCKKFMANVRGRFLQRC